MGMLRFLSFFPSVSLIFFSTQLLEEFSINLILSNLSKKSFPGQDTYEYFAAVITNSSLSYFTH